MVGVWTERELVVADDDWTRFHFHGEVLFISPRQPAMARLLGVLEFAAEQDLNSWWGLEGWD